MRTDQIWAALTLSALGSGRWWNAFGVGKPDPTRTLLITVEINPPHEGVNPNTAGLFVRADNGRRYLAHSGKIGGGRPGIGASAFRQTISETEWRDLQTGEGTRKLLLFGPLSEPDFVQQVARFVHRVAAFKAAETKRLD